MNTIFSTTGIFTIMNYLPLYLEFVLNRYLKLDLIAEVTNLFLIHGTTR